MVLCLLEGGWGRLWGRGGQKGVMGRLGVADGWEDEIGTG